MMHNTQGIISSMQDDKEDVERVQQSFQAENSGLLEQLAEGQSKVV